MSSIINGAYDLHVHSAPDILPRKMDDLEMAERIVKSGMAGYAIKSHFFCTAERATLVNKVYSGCRAIGTICLNNSVGGINPIAVEMAGRAGTKLVWFPTTDPEIIQKQVFAPGQKKLAYWAQIVIGLKNEGIDIPGINILKDGKLIPQVYDVLDTMARHNMILATGHVSSEEVFALVKAAKERKLERIIITHVTFPGTFFGIEDQKELAKYGAYMEHCTNTVTSGKMGYETVLEHIKALGADRVVLATDLGQSANAYPDEGLLDFCNRLVESGISETDVRKMVVSNPEALLA